MLVAIVAIVAIQGLLILYLFLWRVHQREQVIVLTHFMWALFGMTRKSETEEKTLEQAYDEFIATAAHEAMTYTWVNPLAKFVRRGKTLFWEERYGRFGMHAYKDYFERIVSDWHDVQRTLSAREKAGAGS